MQIYQRGKSGTFWVRFSAPDGRRIHQSTRTSNRKQAHEFADRLKSDSWRISRLGERPRCTWQEAVLRFLRETQHKRTQDKDIARLRWLDKYLGKLALDAVSADVIDRIKTDILAGKTPGGGTAPANVNRYMAPVRTILRKAVHEWDWLDKAPLIKLMKERPGHDQDFRWLSHQKADRLLDRLERAHLSHTANMARFTLSTGLRESNVTGLQWQHVDMGRRVAWVNKHQSKSGRGISVPLNDEALKVLRQCRFKHPSRVFTFKGRPVVRANSRAWREVLKAEGLKPHKGRHPDNFRWHDLRHTWASWHVMAGTPLEVLQRLGGWATLDMVMRYAHLGTSHVAAYAGNVIGPNLAQKISSGRHPA